MPLNLLPLYQSLVPKRAGRLHYVNKTFPVLLFVYVLKMTS